MYFDVMPNGDLGIQLYIPQILGRVWFDHGVQTDSKWFNVLQQDVGQCKDLTKAKGCVFDAALLLLY